MARALDPLLAPADVARARAAAEDTGFQAERLDAVCRRLDARRAELAGEEEQARRRAAYRAAEAERDALAAELAETYPDAAERLAGLFGRLQASDTRAAAANQALPAGAEHLAPAESHARGAILGAGASPVWPVTSGVRPPCWEPRGAPFWPREER